MLLSSMYLTSFTSSYFFRIYKIRGTHPSARNADNSRHTGMRMRRLVNQKRTPLLSPPPQLLSLVLTLLALLVLLPLLPFLLAWASIILMGQFEHAILLCPPSFHVASYLQKRIGIYL